METVASLFGAAAAGSVFVLINPLFKPKQVAYILRDCNVRVLVTSAERADLLAPELRLLPELQFLIMAGGGDVEQAQPQALRTLPWASFLENGSKATTLRAIDTDIAAILCTSGSTGKPK